MSVEVSVVVPVYNTGAFIEPCIDSLVGQTLAASRYEVVFVDDGSTDETPHRLDQLAAEYPNMRVIHETNSGWSGRPRNVGLDAARGDYVFFCDHDDWLELDALERMTRFARDNDSDVVVAKMVGHRRGVPVDLFDHTVGDTTPWTQPLMTSLTPHKLFRRSFLNAHKLRFPEAKRRLEDHIFVVGAYVQAERIAVLGDGLYYHHIRRPDAGNAGFGSFDAVSYYAAVRDTLDVIERHVEAGPRRDALMRRTFSTEMIERLRGQRLRVRPEAEHRTLFSEVHNLLVERFPPGFENRTGALTRVFASAVRADQFDVAMDLNNRSAGLAAHASLTSFGWVEHGWQAEITAELLMAEGSPVTLTPAPDGQWLVDTRLIPAELQVPLDSDEQVRQVALRLTLVNRTTDEEWGVATDVEPELKEIPEQPGTFRLLVRARADIQPGTAAGGRVLPGGLWDVRVRLGCLGATRQTQLGQGTVRRTEVFRPAIVGDRPATVIPYFTKRKSNLALDVGQSSHTLRAALLGGSDAAPVSGAAVPVAIDVEPGAAPRPLRLSLLAGKAVVGHCAARIVGGTSQATLTLARPSLSGKSMRTVPRGEYTISARIRKRDQPTVLGRVRVNLRGEIVMAELTQQARQGVAPLPPAYHAQRRARAILRRLSRRHPKG